MSNVSFDNMYVNDQPHVKMTIALLNEDGDNARTEVSYDVPYFPELGDTEIQCIFTCFQKFLYTADYTCYGGANLCLFDEPITGDEYDALKGCLERFRKEANN